MHALLRVPIPELSGMGRAVSLNPAFAAGDEEWGGFRRGSPQVEHQEFSGTGKH